jgi:rubrerythrin
MAHQIDQAMVVAMLDRLTNYPSNGKPPDDDTTYALILCGFIERINIDKACPACGTPRLDYSWLKITAGGRAFMAAALTAPHANIDRSA